MQAFNNGQTQSVAICFKEKCRSDMSQPHFGQSVRMKLTLPKVETWSPPRLPQL